MPHLNIKGNEPWNEFVASVRYETTLSNQLQAIGRTKPNGFYGLYKGTSISRQRYSQLITGKSRPGTDLLHELAQSPQLTDDEKKLLLKLESTQAERKQLIARLKNQNFPPMPEQALDSKIRAAGQLSPAGLRKIEAGCLCNFSSALKLCFALLCTPEQADELLALYGYKLKDDYVHKKLQERCWDIQRLREECWILENKAA